MIPSKNKEPTGEKSAEPFEKSVESEEWQNMFSFLIKLNEGIKTLPLKELWILCSTLGGLMLLAYCWRIGYYPEFDLTSLVVTFFSIAVIGIVIVLMLSLIFCLPTIFLANISRASHGDEKSKLKKIVWEYGGFLGAFAVIEALFVAVIKCPILNTDPKWGGEILSYAPLVIFALYIFACLTRNDNKWKNIFKHIVAWSAWLFVINILAILITSPSLFRQKSSGGEIFKLLFMLFSSGAIQVFFASFYNSEEIKAKTSDLTRFVLIPFFLIVIFVCGFALLSGNKLWIVEGALHALGMKTYQDKRITLTIKSQACEAINLIESKACKLEGSSKIGVLEDIELLSTVGSTFFIQTKEKSRLVINKSDVVVWKEFRRGKNESKLEP